MNKDKFNIDSFRHTNDPFSVPDGYFDTQRDTLLAIAQQKKRITLRTILWSAAAALLLTATTVSYLMTQSTTTTDLDSYVASLSDQELTASISIDEYDTFFEYTFYEE